MFNLVQKRNTGEFVPIRQVVMNAMEKIEKAAKNKGSVTGIPTGFLDLDYKHFAEDFSSVFIRHIGL